MKIDNRKVNGWITIDAEDIIDSSTTKCSIDIGELIAGVILGIDLPSGTITVKESK